MTNRLFALIIIIILSPIFIVISIAILFEDGYPIFFTQKRVGINYTFFKIYKFRSMKKDTPNVATHLLTNPDQYLLRIGKIIRKTSLDELPNLINIIKGEMLFVGPRPALYNQDDLMQFRVATGVAKFVILKLFKLTLAPNEPDPDTVIPVSVPTLVIFG